jgi:hypothetical protein
MVAVGRLVLFVTSHSTKDGLNTSVSFSTIFSRQSHSSLPTGAYSPGRTFGLPFRGFLITHTDRHTVGLLWTSDQPVAETSTYTGQHNIETQQTNIHTPSGIRTRDSSNRAAVDLRLRPRGGQSHFSGMNL